MHHMMTTEDCLLHRSGILSLTAWAMMSKSHTSTHLKGGNLKNKNKKHICCFMTKTNLSDILVLPCTGRDTETFKLITWHSAPINSLRQPASTAVKVSHSVLPAAKLYSTSAAVDAWHLEWVTTVKLKLCSLTWENTLSSGPISYEHANTNHETHAHTNTSARVHLHAHMQTNVSAHMTRTGANTNTLQAYAHTLQHPQPPSIFKWLHTVRQSTTQKKKKISTKGGW